METVLGKDVTVRIYNEGWKMYACATGCSLTVSTSTVETSVTGSGIWATFAAQKHSWSGSLEGVVNLDSNLTIRGLRGLQIAMTPIQIQFERIDPHGSSYTTMGEAIIVNSTDSGSYDGAATFSVELQGTGAIIEAFDLGDIFDDSFDETFN